MASIGLVMPLANSKNNKVPDAYISLDIRTSEAANISGTVDEVAGV